jgi:sugar-specific transcriptional regulator TrmB
MDAPAPLVSPDEVDVDLPADRLSDLLADERRRRVLRTLAEQEGPVDLSTLASAVADSEADDPAGRTPVWRRVYLALSHVHVPMLADAGLVEFDRAATRVRPWRTVARWRPRWTGSSRPTEGSVRRDDLPCACRTPAESGVPANGIPVSRPWAGAMPTEDEAVHLLEELGLTEYESRCYVALTRVGNATAKEVSDLSDVPRSRVYDAVDRLHERGLVDVQQSDPRAYQSVPVEVALESLREEYTSKVDAAGEALDKLERAETQEHTGAWAIADHDHVSDRIGTLVDDAATEVYLLVVDGDVVEGRLVEQVTDAASRGASVVVEAPSGAVAEADGRPQVGPHQFRDRERPSGTVPGDGHLGHRGQPRARGRLPSPPRGTHRRARRAARDGVNGCSRPRTERRSA